ncbi:telomere-binding protein 1 [Trypanosoma conorhini]|uniref:Telomere-binding protein 1 n=1 Tax=Trypanosoma conorhini TaxID=83891 RepID=A0A422PE55_9TRYP|nr:telomere-binding protein 1 [Trypanosoma conorhini]RNF15997.1 telomere-binding protein 1 [Trypanosoma conorhini]
MDRGDFDFPPDPSVEAFGSTLESLNSVPLRVLSNMPIEELPPTVVPAEQQRPIRQMMRGGRRLRRAGTLRKSARASAEPAHDALASQPGDAAEGGEPTSSLRHSFAGHKRARFDWSEEELRDFYKFLSQYGTDFNAIAVMYQGRSREDVKRLYHRELRKRRDDVRAALSSREEIDLGTFRARLKKREELQQVPARQLEQEEEEALRLIETGALQFRPTCNEGEAPVSDAGNSEFEFDFVAAKNPTPEKASPTGDVKTACASKHDDDKSSLPALKSAEASSVRNTDNGDPLEDTLLDDFLSPDQPSEDLYF